MSAVPALLQSLAGHFLRSPRPEVPDGPLPSHLTIEVTTICNVHPPCVMCGKHFYPQQGWLNRDASHFPSKFIPKLEKVLQQLRCLSLYGIGEPLTCPNLFDFTHLVPATCHTQLTSNGWLLNPQNRQRLITHRISQIDISLDAATAERYRKIRHGDFEPVLEKIQQLVAERRQQRATCPNVILNMCLMRENIDDLPEFVRLARRIGADYCYAFHLNQGMSWQTEWFDYEQQHCALDAERHDARVAEAFQVSAESKMPFGIKGRPFFDPSLPPPTPVAPNLPSPSQENRGLSPQGVACDLPWKNAIVYRSGKVSNCCWQKSSLGNLEDHTFEEIWFGAKLRAVRAKLLAGSYADACLGKSTCPPRGRP